MSPLDVGGMVVMIGIGILTAAMGIGILVDVWRER